MPTTRSAHAAAARAAARLLLELPTEVLGLVLYQLLLAHDIAAVAPTSRALCDAAKLALKLRPYSGEVVTLDEHGYNVRVVQSLADGRIITGSPNDQAVKVWSGSGVCVHTIDFECYFESLAMIDGARFICCRYPGFAADIWDLNGALERTIEKPSLDGKFRCVSAMPDGVHFVVGHECQNPRTRGLSLYHVDGTLVHRFYGHFQSVNAVAVSRDGQHIVSAGDKRVKVWHVASKSELGTCFGHNETVWSVAFMPDGQRILSGSLEGYDYTLKRFVGLLLMHRLDGTLVRIFSHHEATPMALAPLPDNTHVLSASRDTTVKLFNVDDGAVLRTFRHHTRAIMSLALLPDGLRFVSGSEDNTARIAYHGLAPA